ncbi:MAG: diacylglycerol kinase [Ectothiorhodospiraceae bacterium]|nr:diacylglycerol kinase [Chromatiales bacterium]MCP5155719.1 diacylglycerol kinase [Ectothiorhodospiraceae bacterium]
MTDEPTPGGKVGAYHGPRWLRATLYSRDGLLAAWRGEQAFREEAVAAAVLIPVAVALPIPLVHRAALVVSVLAVLAVELLNSAVEAVVDRHGEAPHPLAKRAKDMGSAAVLMTLVGAAVIWAAVLAEWLL